MWEHLPATLPHCQFAVMGSAARMKRKRAGHGGKDRQAESKQESPNAPQRNTYFKGWGGLCDTRGTSTKCTSPQSRVFGVPHEFIRYSVNGYCLGLFRRSPCNQNQACLGLPAKGVSSSLKPKLR